MSARGAIGLTAACLLVLGWAASAPAQERTYWRDSKGFFEKRGKDWVEERGDVKSRFVETDQTDDYVELFDRKRETTVRLYNDRCMVKVGRKKFDRAHDGEWEKVLEGLDQDALDQSRKQYEGKGWHPVHIKGYDGKEPKFDITWRSGPTGAWHLGFYPSAKDFAKQDRIMKKDGKSVAVDTHYRVGSKEWFAAIWTEAK
jgi:hypothetical protein